MTAAAWSSTTYAVTRTRDAALDGVRGLAVALMVLDHVCAVTGSGHLLRYSVTRLSMPLFFVVSGHLVRRLSSRHLWVLLAGLMLPGAVPWIDNPNVLVWY